MDKRTPKNGFKKGQSGNPNGRKPLSPDIRAARNLSYEEMCRTVIQVRSMTQSEAKKLDIEKEPLGKRAILNAYLKLDYRGIKDYEDRLWGKAQEAIKLVDDDGQVPQFKIIIEKCVN